MEHRPLGGSGIEVSVLALGSWRTFERISREQGVAVMRAAREAGIDFLDDARYNDETGAAPIPTGWSEVVFGELFREAGWRRDEVTVANKLWWEFWPRESAAQELDGSLGRMRLDHVDLIYAERPAKAAGLTVAEAVESCAALVAAGKARAWGVLNWAPAEIREAAEHAAAHGLPAPCAAQLAYSLVSRSPVEDAATTAALEAAGASVVASASLAFGALSGKYARGEGGRIAGELDDPRWAAALAAAAPLAELASRLEKTPAPLAYAFALSGPRVASVLCGATSPEQVAENAGAAELARRLAGDDLAALRAIGG